MWLLSWPIMIFYSLEQIRLPNNWSILLVMTMKTLSLIGWLIGIWRPHFLAVTFWWTLIAFHQWLKTIIGTNKIVQFHTLKRQCTLSEKLIEALLLNMCKFEYILNPYFKWYWSLCILNKTFWKYIFTPFYNFRIPESKQHMVLPEIEEEVDDPSGRRASKLSLTSLLLGKNLESYTVWNSLYWFSNLTSKKK